MTTSLLSAAVYHRAAAMNPQQPHPTHMGSTAALHSSARREDFDMTRYDHPLAPCSEKGKITANGKSIFFDATLPKTLGSRQGDSRFTPA